MSLQVSKVVLYSHSGAVRELSFRLSQPNVITGDSKTGKTALIEIIDYCLGRKNCHVSGEVIRKTVSWFGLQLKADGNDVFIARKNPLPDASTSSEIFFLTGPELRLPTYSELEQRLNVDELVAELDRIVGITPNEFIPTETSGRVPYRATIRHASLFCFQHQNEIQSELLLFHREREDFISQTIKDVLPFFLGASSVDALDMRRRLRAARKKLRVAEREHREMSTASEGASTRAVGLIAEAIEVGLLPRSVDTVTEDPISQLRRALDVADDEIGQAGGQASVLRQRLRDLRQEYATAKRRLEEAVRYNSVAREFQSEAGAQAARLSVVDVLPESANDHTCPLCGNATSSDASGAEIRQALDTVRVELRDFRTRQPRVDELISGLRGHMAQLSQSMSQVTRELRRVQLLETSDADGPSDSRELVRGRIDLFLEIVGDATKPELTGLGDLVRAVEDLEAELSNDVIREKVDSFLNVIGGWMSTWASQLRLEHAGSPHRLDFNSLLVVADTSDGPIRMSRMGSAANWLGCHLIAHIGLHRWFDAHDRPVPRFLFLDQPSQPFFKSDDTSTHTDTDRENVRRHYEWLFKTRKAETPGVQLIIVDHAYLDEEWFRAAIIEDWRDGRALIPAEWIRERDGDIRR